MYETKLLIELYRNICDIIEIDDTKRIYIEEFLCALEPISILNTEQFREVISYFENEGLFEFVSISESVLNRRTISKNDIKPLVMFAKRLAQNNKLFDEPNTNRHIHA